MFAEDAWRGFAGSVVKVCAFFMFVVSIICAGDFVSDFLKHVSKFSHSKILQNEFCTICWFLGAIKV